MEKGRSNQIIDRLVDMVENGKRAPFSSSKVVVDRDEMVRMLREMENIVKDMDKVRLHIILDEFVKHFKLNSYTYEFI